MQPHCLYTLCRCTHDETSFFAVFVVFFFYVLAVFFFFFFFQAEDGIRDGHVTGVQTCALPILKLIPLVKRVKNLCALRPRAPPRGGPRPRREGGLGATRLGGKGGPSTGFALGAFAEQGELLAEIGRASCRERGWISVVAEGVEE